jgi:hypothetical protein
LTEKESSLKTKADCESYAWNYLDIVDTIAYMYQGKKIPPDVIDYFDNNFLYALLLREWLLENKIRDELPRKDETWYDLINFCNEHKMASFDSRNRMVMNYAKEKDRLPYAMQDYKTLSNDDR